jgi:hypothetical protein
MPVRAVVGMVALVANMTIVGTAAQRGELIERTLAIVAGQAITLSDVETARALNLVRADDVNAATERLVERALILREVQRYAPSEPTDAAIQQRLDELRAQLPAEQFERVLAVGGFTEARLRAWIRDDLRIASYLDQRFAAAATGGQSRADLIADWVADLRRRTPVVELWKKPPLAH